MNTKTKEKQGYESDTTDTQWAILVVFLQRPEGAGRPLKYELRQIVNAILYLIRTSCQWRYLPNEYPNYNTVYYHFRKWSQDGTLDMINSELVKADRKRMERSEEPSGAILDSQSVKTTEAGGEKGFHAGKQINGRSRHVMTDTVGHLLKVVVTAADVQDRQGAQQVIAKLSSATRTALKKIWADGHYTGEPFLTWLTTTIHGVLLEIAMRPPNQKGFIVVPVRWVIERTFAWLGRSRRLSKDYEHCTKSSEGMIYFASIALLLKRLAPVAA